jgi:hypothetical protein
MPSNDVLTRNEEGDLAVRTVSATESSTVVNPNDVYTRDEDGNLAIRTVGGSSGGGGDQHNLGWYATQSALETAHPTATAGDWAIVGSTDTVWVWDTDTSAWKDSDQKGQVTSVNNQTGDVTVQETLVSGTNIKTINNQSVLGSGNISIASGGGIDWTGHWDMPTSAAGYVYLRLDCNMLPAGHYRFYQQTFNFTGYYNNLQPDTYMIDFYVDSSNGIAGVVNRVMDGQSTFADYNSFEYYSRDVITAAIFDSNSKLGFWSTYNLMMSNISTYTRSEVVNNVFRWTDIKNVDTNDTYPLTAYIVYDEIPEPSDKDNSFGLSSLPSINQPEQPTNYVTSEGVVQSGIFGVKLDNFGTISYRGSNYYDGSPSSSSVKIYLTDYKDSVFDAELFVEKTYCIINKATGIFENTEFVVNTDSIIYIKYNFSNQDVGTHFYISAGKAGGNCTQIYLNEVNTSEMQTTYPVPCVCVGRTVTPNVLGQIQQYTGTTNANYTNGYFYKASGTLTLTPSTATISVSSPSGATVSVDLDALIPLLRKYYYYSYSYIIEQFTNGTSCTYVGDGSSVNILYNIFTQPDVLACFTVTGNNGNNVNFNISNLVVNGYSVSNGHWEQVDVQPSSGGGSSTSTTASLVVANWSNNSQTVNVTGVTANNNVIVAPAPASQANYTAAGIICTAQGAGTLTFTCQSVPSSAITVNVLII